MPVPVKEAQSDFQVRPQAYDPEPEASCHRSESSFAVYIFPSFEKRIEILGVLLSDRFRDNKLLPDCLISKKKRPV